MCVKNQGQSVRDKPTVSYRKAVTRSLNLSKRAEEAEQAEDSAENQSKKQKLVPSPQPLPSHNAVPHDDILNKEQT
jgi:hypothetical protein